ncbi:hypothetical protein DsansV1_C02g0014231 [Dioscorea sansibarensis]
MSQQALPILSGGPATAMIGRSSMILLASASARASSEHFRGTFLLEVINFVLI